MSVFSREGVSLRVFLNLRRMYKYENLGWVLPLHKQFSFCFLAFHKKETLTIILS